MFSKPYEGISDAVASVLKDLISKPKRFGSDEGYHTNHTRRYARTLELLNDASLGSKLLEIGTSSVIPLSLEALKPDLEVEVTHFDTGLAPEGEIVLSLSEHHISVPYMRIDIESEKIPRDDNYYDSVLCSEVIEHLDVDPMFMLSEINRVLKPGGTLILTTPNACSTHAIYKILRGHEPYFYMQYHKDRSPYRHNYEYSKYTLEKVLKAAGFSGKVWSESTFEDPIMEDIERLNRADYGLVLDELGDNLFAVMTKKSRVKDRHPPSLYV